MRSIKLYILSGLFAVTFLNSCKKTDFAAEQQANSTLINVGDYIKNNFDFTIFSAALEKTGLMDSLNNTSAAYTVFAPDDNAFHTDSILSIADLDKINPDTLRFLVRNHIMRGKLFYSDIPVSLDNLYPNLNGLNLYISGYVPSGGNPSLAVSGVPVEQIQTATTTGTVFDIPLANGVIHILSRVMKYSRGTIQDFIAGRPDLSSFAAGLKKFNLWDSLRTAGPLTVIAPVNSAFDTNHITPDSIAALDTSKVQAVLFAGYIAYPHHIFVSDAGMVYGVPLAVSGGYLLAFGGFPSGTVLTTPAGLPLGPLGSNSNYEQRYSPFLNTNSTDYLCSNGVVHLISQIMVLPSDVLK